MYTEQFVTELAPLFREVGCQAEFAEPNSVEVSQVPDTEPEEEPNSVDTASMEVRPPNSMEVPDLRPVGEDVSPVPPSAVLQPS